MPTFRATDISKILFNDFSPDKLKQDESVDIDKHRDKKDEVKYPVDLSNDTNTDSVLTGVVMGTSVPVIGLDKERNIIILNKAAQQLFSIKSTDVTGKSIDQIIQLYEDKKELMSSDYTHLKEDSFEGVIYEGNNLRLQVKTKLEGDKELYVSLTVRQVSQGQDSKLGCVLTFRNITNDLRLDEMKMGFVTLAAHELRTPITSIKGYLSVFNEEYAKQLNNDQKQLLEHVGESTERLSALVENLLSVSKVERGMMFNNLEAVDLVELVKGVINQIRPQSASKNIGIELITPKTIIPKVNVDKPRIAEVVGNLLKNATQYNHPGGTISVSIEQKKGELVTHFQDTGTGIDKKFLPYLFTKFYQVTDGLTRQNQGGGLGLYIAKAIVEMHHGKIWVDSKPGKGSVFSFSLPI